MNLSDLPQTLSSADRIELQRAVEKAIVRLNPDHADAHDLLDALIAALRRRYGKEVLWDVEHYAEFFGQALERIPLCEAFEIDEMATYRDSIDAE